MFLQVFKDVENFKVLMLYVDFFRIDNIPLGMLNLGGIQFLCNSRVGMSTAKYSKVTILFTLILNTPKEMNLHFVFRKQVSFPEIFISNLTSVQYFIT